MGKIKSKFLARYRYIIQILASLGSNMHLGNFFKGTIYQGAGKNVCLPGLNCYSCPGATGACPIGAIQAVVGSAKYRFSYYVLGTILFFGVLLGRAVCGFLCPFGFVQEILHKIPTKKFSTERLRPLTYLKYLMLLLFVLVLPVFVTNQVGMGNPFFCKYICPAGILEGGIPLSLANQGIRASLGSLFQFKLGILIATLGLSIVYFRPFCKWICPLGALYALVNSLALFQVEFKKEACINCNKCDKACKMDVHVRKSPNHPECIRCGMCIKACPTKALSYTFGFEKSYSKEIQGGNK